MRIRYAHAALAASPLMLCWGGAARAEVTLPPTAGAFKAIGPVKTYDPRTVYDYMDGAAEVYLSYGMTSLAVQVYELAGEPPITLDVFTMERPAGAFGVFTYERVDAESGLGQGSEYASGILRFWQGNTFVFIQAMKETPAVKAAIFALAKSLSLGPPGPVPALVEVLPKAGLRPLSVRYVLGRQLVEAMETLAMDNALGLPVRCEAVAGRYGEAGKGERVFVLRYPDANAATMGIQGYLKGIKPGAPAATEGLWQVAATQGAHAVWVLGAASRDVSLQRLQETLNRLKEIVP